VACHRNECTESAMGSGWLPERSKGGETGLRPVSGDMSGGGCPVSVARAASKYLVANAGGA